MTPHITHQIARFIIAMIIVLTLGTSSAFSASKQAKGPRGIDPATLKLNTESEPARTGMVDLFNGKDLSGWSVKGGPMPWTARDGIIIGKCDPEIRLNSFLATDKNYRDFIFTAEYRWEVASNSGIMFRADTRPLDDREKAKVKDHSLLRVFGYQCEVESSDRRWTGGIYGEAMGGWKYPLSKQKEHAKARGAVKELTGWNRVTIRAQGKSILTWINGVPCANLTSDERTDGFIALQVHQGRKGEIHWRNLRLKDLAK